MSVTCRVLPVPVQATQFAGTVESASELWDWLDPKKYGSLTAQIFDRHVTCQITLVGGSVLNLHSGDWVVKWADGWVFCLSNAAFRERFEVIG